jgi:hypothetical protein
MNLSFVTPSLKSVEPWEVGRRLTHNLLYHASIIGVVEPKKKFKEN